MKKIIELKNISKTYKIGENEYKALDNIDLSYIYSIFGSFIVTIVVNKVLAKKVKTIDMVTSLKANE